MSLSLSLWVSFLVRTPPFTQHVVVVSPHHVFSVCLSVFTVFKRGFCSFLRPSFVSPVTEFDTRWLIASYFAVVTTEDRGPRWYFLLVSSLIINWIAVHIQLKTIPRQFSTNRSLSEKKPKNNYEGRRRHPSMQRELHNVDCSKPIESTTTGWVAIIDFLLCLDGQQWKAVGPPPMQSRQRCQHL